MRPAIRSVLALPIVAFGLTACAAPGPPRAAGPAQLPVATTPGAGIPGRPGAASQELQHHARASAPRPPALPSPVAIALDAASLARAPQRVVAARVDGALRCRGVALLDLLRSAGAVATAPLQGLQLARYVLADGMDGERVLFSLAELDPPAGSREVAVVGHCGDVAADAAQQPPRLLASDGRRGVRRLRAIAVVVAP